ncbi:hypothetical protein BKA63DRAFT_602499 [Paraphoma chrysanthemicola]|nr:hypothetical protein BKA63DRAFT_602499 [Paraphoma chrysanthemicola]
MKFDDLWNCYECNAVNAPWCDQCPNCGADKAASDTLDIPLELHSASEHEHSGPSQLRRESISSGTDNVAQVIVVPGPTAILQTSASPTKDTNSSLANTRPRGVNSDDDLNLNPNLNNKALHHYDPLSVSHDVHWDDVHYGGRRNRSHSESSKSSSYANSLVSTASLASSATDFSRNTGYSAIQIARATKELIRVLQDDPDLARLYKYAIVDPSIGPEKLERNLRRSFRNYADILGRAAGDTLEYLASRLVKLKARAVAQVIVQKYGSNNSVKTTRQDQEQSSDEESDARPVDESIFEDIISFREFLVGGKAFTMLHSQIRSFVIPKTERGEDITAIPGDEDECVQILETGQRGTESSPNHPSPSLAYGPTEQLDVAMNIEVTPHGSLTNNLENMKTLDYTYSPTIWPRALVTHVMVFTSAALIACGYLEPPVKVGVTRLRWICRCGDELHGDVVEFRAGGISRLIERMQRSTGTKVIATTYSQNGSNQQYISAAPAWMRAAARKISSAFSRSENLKECLPRHTNQTTPSTSAHSGSSHTPIQNLLLMACMQGDQQLRRIVHQDPIDDITTDKALFTFMKMQLTKRRNSLGRLFSLRCIQGLHFVKFRLWASGDAEVYDSCCTSPTPHACQRIPPATIVEPSKDAEYRCTPAGPLDVGPPIVSRLMMHWLKSPECVHEDETLVFDQLPKRICGKLEGKVRHPADGWGLHFEEGQDYGILAGMLLIALMASLLFAIFWSYFKDDVQGAFGVASYIVAAAVAFVALVVNRGGRLG